MSINTVNISFKSDLLKKIDKIAKEESRSRSELIREAARMYIEKKYKAITIINSDAFLSILEEQSTQELI